jgi:integrase
LPRHIRSSQLETPTARVRRPISSKPIFIRVSPGVSLGYRRNRTAGSWVVRVADGQRGNWTERIGAADDFENADGALILTYWQAQDRARARAAEANGSELAASTPKRRLKVADAVDRYEMDLKSRRGDPGNAGRLRHHLGILSEKAIDELTATELRDWRNGLVGKLVPATVNRIATCLKAALNLVADDQGTNRSAWEVGLKTIPDAEESRNVILADTVVRQLVAEAPAISVEFGLLVEVLAVTGARIGQAAGLRFEDLHAGAKPRLLMPASRKGRGTKKISHRPVPIPADLAQRLAAAAAGRSASAPLLAKPVVQKPETNDVDKTLSSTEVRRSSPWKKSDHSREFRRLVVGCGLDPTAVSINALRHSSIVRQLLAGVPGRVVAVNHDTSLAMLERTYSRFIGDHADELVRSALLDVSADAASNVVPLASANSRTLRHPGSPQNRKRS